MHIQVQKSWRCTIWTKNIPENEHNTSLNPHISSQTHTKYRKTHTTSLKIEETFLPPVSCKWLPHIWLPSTVEFKMHIKLQKRWRCTIWTKNIPENQHNTSLNPHISSQSHPKYRKTHTTSLKIEEPRFSHLFLDCLISGCQVP